VTDTLNGGAVLPGFTLPVKDIFPEKPFEKPPFSAFPLQNKVKGERTQKPLVAS